MEDIKKIPVLRFSEFSGVWEMKQLKDIGYFYYGKGAPKTSIFKDAKTPCVRYGELYSTYLEHIKKVVSKTNVDPENLKLSKGGEVLVPRVGEKPLDFCMCSYLPFSGVAIGEMISVFNTEENGLFYTYKFNSLRKEFARFVEGASVSNLYFRYLEGLIVGKPSLVEQQKIVDFLTRIDNKIEQLNKKKQLLESYKKGAMQKIFSQELMFKDDEGNSYPDWENKKLGAIGKTYNGLTGKTKEDFGEGKAYIQYKQIFDNSKININNFGYVDIKKNDKQNLANYGDVFFTTSSETPLEVGFSSVLLNKVKEVYLNSFCFGYRINSLKTLNPEFSQYLFRNDIFRKNIVKLAQGSTRYNMSKIALMKLNIKIPAIEEQTKIANFLTKIDNKINLVEKQLNDSKEYKKGLLQKMFI